MSEYGYHCLKCDTWFEDVGERPNGILCPECIAHGYTLFGVCHRERLPRTNEELRAELAEARAEIARLKEEDMSKFAGEQLVRANKAEDEIVFLQNAFKQIDEIINQLEAEGSWDDPLLNDIREIVTQATEEATP